jgi:hypothetical protein
MSDHFYAHYVLLCWLSLDVFGFVNTTVEFYALSFDYHYFVGRFLQIAFELKI